MNNKNNNKNKLLLLKQLKILFEQNDLLILYIISKCYKKTYFFYYPIINLYLSEDVNEEDLKFLDDFLFLINSYITLHKKIFEYIYQKLSKFFTNSNKKLNESQFIRYLYLLKLFYTDTNISETNEKNINIKENENNIIIEKKKSKIIKNYIYFTGNDNSLLFSENDNPTNGNISFPSLNNGISFIFWFNIKKDLIDYQSQVYPDKEINLIILTISEYKIRLIFKENKFFIIKINELESNKINAIIKENEWNFLSFVINPKEKDDKKQFKLIINNTPLEFKVSFNDNFPLKKKIDNIKCFENFIGKISSILFFSFALNEKKILEQFTNVDYLSSGFYKNKILFRFLYSQNENYFKYENNYKYKDLYKDVKISKNNFNFESKNKKINNLINLFCPFAYNKETNQLDDIFGNYLGKLSKNDGANFFINYTKDIIQIGDINNLIPIAELMLSSLNGTPNPSYTQVEKGILSEQTFLEFLSIIKLILNKHKRNIKYINSSSSFLWNLSLFLEKFPRNIYTEKIMNIFIDIEKEINIIDSNDIKSNNEYYINYILLNENIFSKFAEENQNKFWKRFFELFREDLTKLENYINISRICQILRIYDAKRNEQFCCSFHANLIMKENEKRKKELNGNIMIMKPKMEKKVENFFNVVQLYIDKLINIKTKENNNIINSGKKITNLYQLLCLDLSPCLQKKIIQVYINHFNYPDENISKDDKLESLKNLFRNDFIEITEYILSISLIDIRHHILSLFITILNNFFDTFISYYHGDNVNNSRLKNIMYFIGNNPLPNDSRINFEENKDDNYIIKNKNNLKENDNIDIQDDINIKKKAYSFKNSNKQLNQKLKDISYIFLPLINPINNINDEVYEKEIKSLNAFLTIWVKHLCDSKKEINPFIIELLINFSKKLSINYIYKLSFYLLFNVIDINKKKTESNSNSKLKNLGKLFSKKTDNNEEINNDLLLLTGKKNIYNWVVDTIFFFKNKENINDFSEKNKQKIYTIQSYSIEVFKTFFNDKNEAKELNLRIKYLFDYLTYMKNYYKNTKEKSDELVNIARELIEIIFKFSEENINIITIFCFRFIIFFKTSDKLFNINLKNNSSTNESNKINIIENKIINNQIDNKNIFINNESKLEGKSDLIIDKENNSNSSDQNALIPDYILEGLYLNNIDKLNQEEKKNLKIENIWKDFSLCNGILSVYQNKLWCKEYLCNKINVENNGDLITTAKLLLEKYGNKNDKKINNILMTEILELSSWAPEILIENNEDISIEIKKGSDNKLNNIIKKDSLKQKSNSYSFNILYLNIILLSVEVHLSKNDDKIKYINQYQQFLIFCILASININPSVKQYDFIQNVLYNILGYGFSFLKLHSEDKYNELIKVMIQPIIDEINQDFKKAKLRNIFGIQNKILHRNTAIFKLFMGIALEGSEKNKDKDNQQNNNKNKVYFDFKIDVNKFIKEIFESTLEGYKNYIEQNPLENIVNFYEKFNEDNTEDKILIEEKKIITKRIKELINLNKYETKENISNKNIRYKKFKKNYKKKKAELFSWRGFWSDRFLFLKHPEYLKYKIKNHYTEGMYRVLLSPILDVKYYLPNFLNFDKNKLFNKNDYKYNINMNIDEIVQENVQNAHKDISNKNKKENISNNTHKFNYLESIYKNNYEGIWELYQNKSNKSSSNKKLEKSRNSLNVNKINEKNQNSITIENKIISKKTKYIQCCLVKPSHHIKGKIKIDNNNFIFSYENNEFKSAERLKQENENDPKFDKLSGCCFGSYFKPFLKDKDKFELVFKYSDIKYIFIRIYFYYESALEIYTFFNKSYYINFKTNEDMKIFLDNILSQNLAFIPIKTDSKRTLGYVQIINENDKKKCYYISKKQEDWQNYRISTLEYLMWLNIYSCRSFNDITQYPVLPWTLIDFDINNLNMNKRDFSLPMGMIQIDSLSLSTRRKKGYLEMYQNAKKEFKYTNPDFDFDMYLQKGEDYYHLYNSKIVKMQLKEEKKNKTSKGEGETIQDENMYEEIDVSQIPYIYGSHYSNPLYISHYLVRIFPFSFISVQIHGDKFDDPYRMFFSIQKTFECVSTLKEDVRELIPEFYTFPEMLLNINNLDLSQGKLDKDGKEFIVNNVILPSWSENNIGLFIAEMRNFIENNSKDINKWIDLIFGINQRGINAELNNNLFIAYSYEKMVKIEEVKDPKLRETLMRFIEIGVTPFKIFFNETKNRIDVKDFVKKSSFNWHSKDNFIYEYKKLGVNKFNTYKFDNIRAKLHLYITKSDKNTGIKIIYMKQMNTVNKNYLKIITSSNDWYEIKYNNIKGEVPEEDSINKIKNNSSHYTASYSIFNLKNYPIAVYINQNFEYIIKGGFWDGRLEINDLSPDSNHISNCIFPDYNQPIILLKISPDKKYLFCGTYSGNIIVYPLDFNKNSLSIKAKKTLYNHSDEITDIDANSFLNMFASVSKDGYLFLYTLPDLKLVRAIKISYFIKSKMKKNVDNLQNQEKNSIKDNIKKNNENNKDNINNQNDSNNIIEEKKSEESKEKDTIENNSIKSKIQEEDSEQEEESEFENEDEDDIYADNVFLSSSPLPCVTVYISKIKLFITMTLNGEFVSEKKEENNSTYITCSKIIKSLTSQEFLIYGTDNGYIKIRRFPDMKFIGDNIKITNGDPIETLEISEDNKFCFAWSKGNEIYVLNDINSE